MAASAAGAGRAARAAATPAARCARSARSRTARSSCWWNCRPPSSSSLGGEPGVRLLDGPAAHAVACAAGEAYLESHPARIQCGALTPRVVAAHAMAWNQPGDDKKRPPPRGAPAKPRWMNAASLAASVQRCGDPGSRPRHRCAGAARRGRRGVAGQRLLPGDAAERGVVQRFGRYMSVEQPGTVGTGPGRSRPSPSSTSANIEGARFQGADAHQSSRAWSTSAGRCSTASAIRCSTLFQRARSARALRQVSETVVRELVGASAAAVAARRRCPRARSQRRRASGIQKALDDYGAGIASPAVNLTDVQVPDAVLAAQREAGQAGRGSPARAHRGAGLRHRGACRRRRARHSAS